jgi:DNA-binding SARP family transcriptional activator
MEFRILGPLEVAERDRQVALGRGKQRSLLALLLLHANEVVPSEQLIDELWGERPPPTAAKSVQVYVSQLRKALRNGKPESPLLTRGHGYVLRVAAGELDVQRFERALADGRRALAADAPERAAELLRAGLSLWRGPPLADFAYEPFAQAEIARLEELRLAALEERIEADLELGHHAEVVVELEALVSEHPLRERLRGQLMVALYRCDRQAEALEAYRQGRHLLVDELGIEPGPSLRRLEQAILDHDAELAPPRTPRPRRPAAVQRTRRRGTWLLAAGVALVLVAAAAVVAELVLDEPGAAATAGLLDYNAVAAVDPADGAIQAAVPLPDVARLAVGESAVWVGSDASGAISAIDPRTHRVSSIVNTNAFPTDLAAGEGGVWVADGVEGVLQRIDPTYAQVVDSIRFRPPGAGGAAPDRYSLDPAAVAVGAGAVWVTDGGEELMRVDPATTDVVAEIPTGHSLWGVTVGAGAVWAISGPDAALLRIDPSTNRVTAEIEIVDAPAVESPFPMAVAVAGEFVWVLSANTAGITKVDLRSRGIVGTTRIGVDHAPTQIGGAADALWVANDDGTLIRIDAATDDVSSFRIGRSLHDVAVGGGAVWTTNHLSD